MTQRGYLHIAAHRAAQCSRGHNTKRDALQCSIATQHTGPPSRVVVKRQHERSPRFLDSGALRRSFSLEIPKNNSTLRRDVWHHVSAIICNEAEQSHLHSLHTCTPLRVLFSYWEVYFLLIILLSISLYQTMPWCMLLIVLTYNCIFLMECFEQTKITEEEMSLFLGLGEG